LFALSVDVQLYNCTHFGFAFALTLLTKTPLSLARTTATHFSPLYPTAAQSCIAPSPMHASSHFPLLVLLPLLLLPLCSSWVTNSLLLLPAPLSTSLRANIKATIVDIDDTSPSDASLISPIALSVLLPTLNSPETLKIVSAETNKKVKSYVPNTLFQPVGYSAATPHGMPQRIHLDYHQVSASEKRGTGMAVVALLYMSASYVGQAQQDRFERSIIHPVGPERTAQTPLKRPSLAPVFRRSTAQTALPFLPTAPCSHTHTLVAREERANGAI